MKSVRVSHSTKERLKQFDGETYDESINNLIDEVVNKYDAKFAKLSNNQFFHPAQWPLPSYNRSSLPWPPGDRVRPSWKRHKYSASFLP